MIEGLDADPVIRRHYQFWTFGYSTGDPILYTASLLRQALRDARQRYDPTRSDPAFDRMVLVGHSMGGIQAKLMAVDSGPVLWQRISSQPVDELLGPADAQQVLRRSFFFNPVPEVRRIVYIATPHRGSDVDKGALHWVGSLLNQPIDTLRNVHQTLVASNAGDFFHRSFREALPSSVDQLGWEHPSLMGLFNLAFNALVKFHSIIADINNPPGPGGTDGVVPYASSHLDGASSELVIPGVHLCQANPLVISECKRILKEHFATEEIDRAVHRGMPREESMGRLSVRDPDLSRPAPTSRSRVSPPGGDRVYGAEAPSLAR
jgi:pimeloyl-ACP methyl ester carboxylesterase